MGSEQFSTVVWMEMVGRPDKRKKGQRRAHCTSFSAQRGTAWEFKAGRNGKRLRGVLEKNQKQILWRGVGRGGECV